jgi:uncharacterized RDD family membrane protein YckC
MEIRIKRGADEYGPYTPTEVRTYLADGNLARDDIASTDGVTWRPLEHLLATVDGRPPAPAPEGYRPAPVGPRLGAAALDGLVGLVCLAPGLLALREEFVGGMSDRGEMLLVGGAIASVAYGLVKDGLPVGQSLGKRVVGLMVVHLASNRPCSIGQSAVRTLVLLFSNVVPVLGWLVEPILVIATPERRRLGDRAAGTQVIRAADYRPGAGGSVL